MVHLNGRGNPTSQSAEEIKTLKKERIVSNKFSFPEGSLNSSVELSGANRHGNRQDKMASPPRLTAIIITLLKKATVVVITARQSPEDEDIRCCLCVFECVCMCMLG